jgi:hemin uptake protein HemP
MSAGRGDDGERGGVEGERRPERERRLTMIGNRLESRDLFVGTRDIIIMHGAEAYHLRLTAQNKLILTK